MALRLGMNYWLWKVKFADVGRKKYMKHKKEKKKLYSGLYLLLPLVLALSFSLLLHMVFGSWTNASEHKFAPTLNNGHLTICRLKKIEKAHQNANGRSAHAWWCLYEGANGSGFLELVDSYELCPKQVVCEYDPKEKPPSVKDMLNAMKEAFK